MNIYYLVLKYAKPEDTVSSWLSIIASCSAIILAFTGRRSARLSQHCARRCAKRGGYQQEERRAPRLLSNL